MATAAVPQDEVVFLILHYLRNLNSLPPDVQQATGQLESALVQAGLLPTLFDYAGGERVLTYEECARKLPYIEPSYVADALAERIEQAQIPVKTLFSNALLANPSAATTNHVNLLQNRRQSPFNNNNPMNRTSNYSVNAYRKKFSPNLTNVHALLNQMHEVERPLPLRNIMYAILPKAMQRQKRVIGHHQPVYCAIYDSFGDYIVTGSDDHQLKVWSAGTTYLCHTLRGHDREINDITADPSRRILVSASRDSSIRVWDLVTGENKHVLKSGTKGVNCVLFSPCPDRPYLLSGSEDGMARLWNSRNFEQVCVNIPLPSKTLNPRGQTFQTFADSGSIRRMGNTGTVGDSFPAQSPTGTAAESIPASSPSRMSSPPPPVPLANVRDNEVTSGNPPVIVHSMNNAGSAANAGGSVAANNNNNNGNRDSNNNSMITQTTRTPALQVSTQSRGAVGRWGLGSRTSNVPDPRQTTGPVAGAHAMQPRNPPAATSQPPQVQVLGATQNNHNSHNNNNNNNSMVSSSPSCQVLSVAFNTGATRLAISGTDCMTHVYSITKESAFGALPGVHLLTTLRGHSEKITQVLFAHHGDRLCTASADGTARVYRRSTARAPRKKRKNGSVNLAGAGSWKSILLDCRHHHSEVPSASHAGGAASTSITPRVPRGRIPSSVNAVMWSLRDDYIISASSNGKVRVWDSTSGRLKHVLDAHTGEVYIMDTHPFDERVIFTAGYDGKCVLWDIEKGIELRRFFTDNGSEYGNQHPQVINGRFSPDGMSFIVTDTLGALSIFGIGSSDAMLLAPEEQFFANEIVPFRKNAQHRAISQENGQLLHLIPRGELCDSQLRKYALEIQLHSRDFYRDLPGARVEEEASKSVANARNAKGEEFRANQEKEENRLVRAAIEEKRRAVRARKKAELERDLLPIRSMKDFVVPDSEKDSDGDFKLDGNPSDIEMNTSEDDDDSSAESEEYRRPKRKRGRGRRKRIRRQSSKDLACTCPEDCGPNVDTVMSDDGSHDGSDESFRVASDDERSDASGESIRRKKSKDPRRSFAMIDYRSAAASPLPRMQIHLNRPEISQPNQPANGHSPSRNCIPEARRSPGRSLTSERRPDADEVEDKILPQEEEEETPVPVFSRASSSNFPNAMTTKSNPTPGVSAQWSVQSVRRSVEIPSTQVPSTSTRRRRSPRNKSKRDPDADEDEDEDVISKDELENLGNNDDDIDVGDDPPVRRGRRRRHGNDNRRSRSSRGKRVRSTRRRRNMYRNATMRHNESCPIHSDHGHKMDSESEDSDECNEVRRKRRRCGRRFESDANVDDSPVVTPPVVTKGPVWTLSGSEWLRGTSEKYNYIPQRGDSIVYYPIGHSAAIAKSKEIGIDPINVAHESSSSKKQRLNGTALEGKTGPLRFTISAISHEFPKVLAPRKRENVCRRTIALLTLRRNQTDNWPSSVPNEVTLTYFPLDDIPEYLVLSSRVGAALANNWKPADRFRMLFVNEKRVWSYYSGVVVKAAQGFPELGWNSVQVMYDNEDDPDKGSCDLVSPWELEPINNNISTKSCRPITPHSKPSMFVAIANEIHHLQSTDDVFKSSVSWLDTIMKLAANADYCRKVALPMDLPLILMRLCTTYYRHYDAFLDDVGMLKENAIKFNGKKSEAVAMATKVCDIIVKVSQKTKMVMTSSTTPPIPGHPGNSASSRPVKPRTPDSAQTSYVGNMNMYATTGRGPVNPNIIPISIPPRLPSVGYLHPSNSLPGQTSMYQQHQHQHAAHHLRPVMPRLPIPSVPFIPPGSAQASNEGSNIGNIGSIGNAVVPLNMAAIRSPSSRMNNFTQQIISPTNGAAPLPPISAAVMTNHQQHVRHGNSGRANINGNRLPTRSAQSVEAAGGGHFGQFGGQATTSESRVPFYSPTLPAVPPIVGHQSGTSSHPVPYQENSRHEHSTISIAAASTMSCAGENANIGESTENRR